MNRLLWLFIVLTVGLVAYGHSYLAALPALACAITGILMIRSLKKSRQELDSEPETFQQFLEEFTGDAETKNFWRGRQALSINDMKREVANDTEIGRELSVLYAKTRDQKMSSVGSRGK